MAIYLAVSVAILDVRGLDRRMFFSCERFFSLILYFFLLRIRFCRLVNVNQTFSALMNNKCAVN